MTRGPALYLNAENVIEVEVSVNTVRKYFDGDIDLDDVMTGLDNAQGMVFSGDHNQAFLLIKVIP